MSTSFSSHRRPFLAIPIALLIAFCIHGVGAQEQLLSIRTTASQPLRTAGREPLSFALLVANHGRGSRTFLLETILPQGWREIVRPEPLELSAGETGLLILAVLAPHLAPAGTYTVTCRAFDPAEKTLSAACDIEVEVPPLSAMRARLAEGRGFSIAGSDYEVSFSLENAGNTDLRIALQAKGSFFPCRMEGIESGAGLEIPRGGSRIVTVVVGTEATLRQALQHAVTLFALPWSAAGPPMATLPGAVTVTTSTEIIPVSQSGGNPWRTIPVTTETGMGLGGDGGFRGSLSGTVKVKGALDEDGLHSLEAEAVKTLATDEDWLFNRNDRFSLSYRNPWFDLSLGDGGYTISPLIAFNRAGRGALVTATPGPFRFNGLYYRDVWTESQPQGLGGTLGFTVPGEGEGEPPPYTADLGILSTLSFATFMGLWQKLDFSPYANLQLDAAVQVDKSGVILPAVFADAQGDLSWLFYRLRYLRAWPGFHGTWEDRQSISAGGGLRLLDDRLVLQGSWSLEDGNLLLDPSLSSAPRISQIALGASGRLPAWDAEGTIDWINRRQADLLVAESNASVENRFRLAWKQGFDPFTLSALSTLDFIENGSLALEHSHYLSLSWRQDDVASYNLGLEYSGLAGTQGTDRYVPGLSAGVSLAWERTRLDLKTRGTLAFGETGWMGLSVRLGAGFKHAFSWGHVLTGAGDIAFTNEAGVLTPGFSLSLSYGIPFDLPIGRPRSSAVIRGTVIREETGAPIQGVILRLNGLAAVTGRQGDFWFFVPDPGTHYIQVDHAAIGLGLIPSQAMPLKVASAPGSDTVLRIGMVEGCTIGGAVVVYGFPSETDALSIAGKGAAQEPGREKIGGLGNAVIELSGNGTIKRRVTGPDGRFVFQEVVPGSYTLQVTGGNLPAYHKLAQASSGIDVGPGDSKDFEFQVLQEQRQVRILESGFSVLVGPSAEPAQAQTLTVTPEKPAETPPVVEKLP